MKKPDRTYDEDPLLPQAVRMLARNRHPGLQPKLGGKGFLTFSASAFCPGLGHLIAGYYHRAIIFFLITFAFIAALIATLILPRYITALPLLIALTFLAELYQLLDAAECGNETPKKMTGDNHLRYAAGVAFLIAAYIAQCIATSYLENNFVHICGYAVTNMVPAIQTTDNFLVRSHIAFTRWDIVLINSPDPRYAQLTERVVGLPGEKLEITGDQLLIDDIPTPLPGGVDRYLPLNLNPDILDSPSPTPAAPGCWGKPIPHGPHEYYLLGDNSPVAPESRPWLPGD
ncbi:MAG: S26 family signal peptidase, partial [Tepidisphaeraceae bacterium]